MNRIKSCGMRAISLSLAACLALSCIGPVPALAAQSEPEPVYICGRTEHTHTAACYEAPEGTVLFDCIETLPEDVLHTHDEFCYGEDGSLICPLPERKAHEHTDECYTVERTLTCGKEETPAITHHHTEVCYKEEVTWGCGKEETPGHTHTSACYKTVRKPICGQVEHERHKHFDDCYQIHKEVTCGMEDVPYHVHTDSCYSIYSELVCTKVEGEGHAHTDACYGDVQELICGKEETPGHTHTESCKKVNRTLVCGKTEGEPEEVPGSHTHTDACYTETKTLACQELDAAQAGLMSHQHTAACLKKAEPACGLEEHTHTEDCLDKSAVLDTVRVSTWDELLAAFQSDKGAKVVLSKNLSCTQTAVLRSTSMTVELNGHSITSALPKVGRDNTIFRVEPGDKALTLTIQDSGGVFTTGKILGARNAAHLVTVSGKGHLILASGTLTGSVNGAVVLEDDAILTMTGGELTANQAASGSGGGILAKGRSRVEISGGKVSSNSARTGGGIAVQDNARLALSGSAIVSGNSANSDGGGIYIQSEGMGGNAAFTISDAAEVSNNTSKGDGGGVYLAGSAEVTGGKIAKNEAMNGGGLLLSSGSLQMTAGELSDNTAKSGFGGGLYLGQNAAGTLQSAKDAVIAISGNKTSAQYNGGGAGVYVAEGATLTASNVVLTGNSANGFGGGIAAGESSDIRILPGAGGAVYDNSAKGQNKSLGSAEQQELQSLLDGKKLTSGQGKDFFSTGRSVVSSIMLGGGDAVLMGIADGKEVSLLPGATSVSSDYMALNAKPEKAAIEAADKAGTVRIEKNKSSSNGGGILCEGVLRLGSGSVNTFQPVAHTELEGDFEEPEIFHLTIAEWDDATGTFQDMETVDVKGAAKATFQELTFKEAGRHLYSIEEVKGDSKSCQYDKTVWYLCVSAVEAEDQVNPAGKAPVVLDDAVYTQDKESALAWFSRSVELAADKRLTDAVFTNVFREIPHITVKVEWVGPSDKKDIYPESVQVWLIKDDAMVEAVMLSEENDWTYRWEVDDYEGYKVQQVAVQDWKAEVEDKGDGSFTIRNSYNMKGAAPEHSNTEGIGTIMIVAGTIALLSIGAIIFLLIRTRRYDTDDTDETYGTDEADTKKKH